MKWKKPIQQKIQTLKHSLLQALGGTPPFLEGQAAEDGVLEDEGQGGDGDRDADNKEEPERLHSEGKV